MSCIDARDVMRRLHGPGAEADPSDEAAVDLAVKHLTACSACRAWFPQELCGIVKNRDCRSDAEEASLLITHAMLHEPLGTECPYGGCIF